MAIHESLSIATRGTKSTKKLRCGYTASLPASADLGDLIVQNLLFLFRFFRVLRGKNKSFNLLPLCLPLRTSAISALHSSSPLSFFVCFVVTKSLPYHPLCVPRGLRDLCVHILLLLFRFFRVLRGQCILSVLPVVSQTPNQPARLTDE